MPTVEPSRRGGARPGAGRPRKPPPARPAPDDVRAKAWACLTNLLEVVHGDDEVRGYDLQRRAALDVLDLTSLEWMTDAQLAAHSESVLKEIGKRGVARAAK